MLDDLIADRQKKLAKLKEAGVDPYPAKTKRTHRIADVLADFEKLENSKQEISVAGRAIGLRDMGNVLFLDVHDGGGKLQVVAKNDNLKNYALLKETLDRGDFVSAGGQAFTTKTGEPSIEAKELTMLAKSLRPLPDKWAGLEDVETRLRERYVDFLANPETADLFRKKAVFWDTFRMAMKREGFLEMEMPILETVPGGAEAEPFKTHHNALDTNFYLRISLELPLKKMLVAGYEKVFEIGRIFRNEGISPTHLQDYTQLEFYWAYADFEQLMDFVQKMYQQVVRTTFPEKASSGGTIKITSYEIECDWGGTDSWARINYIDLFKKWTGVDLETASDNDLKKYADGKKDIKYEKFVQRGRLIDLIFKRERRVRSTDPVCMKEEIWKKPFFLINQPYELEPLAKRVPGNSKLVQRMQVMAYFLELGKGFGELNDPVDQRIRFKEQMRLREAGDKEAQILDEEFLRAMEYGMPPAAGFGVSERLFAVLMDLPVREAQIFPLMRKK